MTRLMRKRRETQNASHCHLTLSSLVRKSLASRLSSEPAFAWR